MRSFRFRHTHLYVLKPGCTGHGPQRLTKRAIILNETLVKLHRFGQHVCNDKYTHTDMHAQTHEENGGDDGGL